MVALDTDNYRLERGSQAPDFELTGTDGTDYSLSDFEGFDALLVVFTCNHCPYAKAKMDELNYLAEIYDDLAVVGINANDAEEYPDDSFGRMQDLVADGTVAYDAYLRDDTQEVAAAYGAVCTPDPFLFANEDGAFRLAYHGRIDDALNPDAEPTDYEMRAYVETILAGGSVDAEDKPSRGCSIKWKAGSEPEYFEA